MFKPVTLQFFSFLMNNASNDSTLAAQEYARTRGDDVPSLMSELEALRGVRPAPLVEIGTETNQWFSDDNEFAAWLDSILSTLKTSSQSGASSSIIVKDSNGTVLSEGDSVTVIKDLKVKGGSSDLKRGTTIRKIHLVDDPEVIECRVDGSTLVLKTCFLKKA